MKSLWNILQIGVDELRRVCRDKGVMIFILFVPLFYPLLYAYIYSKERVWEVPVAVVDEDYTALSREITRRLDAPTEVKVMGRCADMAEARRRMAQGEIYGIVYIPEGFEADVREGRKTVVGYYADMGSMLYYKSVLIALNKIVLDENKSIKVRQYGSAVTARDEAVSEMPVEYEQVVPYNPQEGLSAFLIPPVLMLIIQQTLLLGIGMAMGNARERYKGLVIPPQREYKNAVHIVLGRGWFYFMLYMVLAVYMNVGVTRMFGLPELGHYWEVIAFMVPYVAACVFMGLSAAFLVYRREDCILLFVFLSVPLLFISGISWPGAAVPQGWKVVSWIFPSTFGLNGYVRLQSMGATLADVSREWKALWVLAGVYMLIATACYRAHIVRMVEGRTRLLRKYNRR